MTAAPDMFAAFVRAFADALVPVIREKLRDDFNDMFDQRASELDLCDADEIEEKISEGTKGYVTSSDVEGMIEEGIEEAIKSHEDQFHDEHTIERDTVTTIRTELRSILQSIIDEMP